MGICTQCGKEKKGNDCLCAFCYYQKKARRAKARIYKNFASLGTPLPESAKCRIDMDNECPTCNPKCRYHKASSES